MWSGRAPAMRPDGFPRRCPRAEAPRAGCAGRFHVRPRSMVAFFLATGLLTVLSFSQQVPSKGPQVLPDPFQTAPDRKPPNALTIGPENTFSVAKTPDDFTLNAFALSPDGRWLAMGWVSGRIELWDLEKKSHASEFDADLGVPMALEFNTTGDRLVVAGLHGKLGLFQLPVGTDLRRWKVSLGKTGYDIQALLLDPQGKWLAYANGGASRVVDLMKDPPQTLADLKDAGSFALSQDGTDLWTVNRTMLTRFSTSSWDLIGQWALKHQPSEQSAVVIRAGMAANAEPSVAVPSKGGLVIYRAPDFTGEFVTDKPGSGVGFARASHTYVSISGELTFLSAGGNKLCKRSYSGRYGYAISADGQWFALSQAGRVDLWRMDDLLRGCAEAPE
jgi:hypothetical protein